MSTRERPLSPHLQIYAKQITSTMSILHRMTGVANALGVLALAWWLVALSAGGEAYAQFAAVAGSLTGQVALFGFAAYAPMLTAVVVAAARKARRVMSFLLMMVS